MQSDDRRTLYWHVKLRCRCSLPFQAPTRKDAELSSKWKRKNKEEHRAALVKRGRNHIRRSKNLPVKEAGSAGSAGSLLYDNCLLDA